MYIILTILTILLSISIFLIINLFKKNEKYENFIQLNDNELKLYKNFIIEFSKMIDKSDNRLKEIDIKGAYSSDDEIGWFFKQIKLIQEKLNNFKVN